MSENIEPFLVQEKIINDDGTPSDYLVRYLNNSLQQGKKTVKFPVTSVNGMTGDVVINLQDIVDGVDINYALLNEKIQEFIAALSAVRQEDIQRMADHQSDWHRWPYQSFHNTKINDSRMMTLGTEATVNGELYKLTPSIYIPNSRPTITSTNITSQPTAINGNSKLFNIFSIDRDITVNRIYIGSTKFANDLIASSCEVQFAIYSAGIVTTEVDINSESYRSIGTKRRIPMRFPNALIWSSDVLSSVNRTTGWPSYIQNQDTSPTINSSTLSWGFPTSSPDVPSFTLRRGIYFVAMAKYKLGAGGNALASCTLTVPSSSSNRDGLSMNCAFAVDTLADNLFEVSSGNFMSGAMTSISIADLYGAGTTLKQFSSLYADKLNAAGIMPNVAVNGSVIIPDSLGLFSDYATGADIAVTSIVRTDEVAVVTAPAHGLSTGDCVVISGASPDAYNLSVIINTVTVDTFNYYISGAPDAATGTIVVNKINKISSAAQGTSGAGGVALSGAFTETTPTDKW